MILEIAQFDIKAGCEADFEAGVARAAPLFRRAQGCRAMALERSIEQPQRYRLLVLWETLDNHTADFRQSSDFQAWRDLVSHCFAAPPHVEHTERCAAGFGTVVARD